MKMLDNRSSPYRRLTPKYFWPLLIILPPVALLTLWFWAHGASLLDPAAPPRPIAPRAELGSDEKATIALFRQASPSVLHITTIAVVRDSFTLNLQQIPEGTGSGFIWDESGNIITNFHVIQKAAGA